MGNYAAFTELLEEVEARVRKQALEEAAKIAIGFATAVHNENKQITVYYGDGALIASAIRKLAEEPEK